MNANQAGTDERPQQFSSWSVLLVFLKFAAENNFPPFSAPGTETVNVDSLGNPPRRTALGDDPRLVHLIADGVMGKNFQRRSELRAALRPKGLTQTFITEAHSGAGKTLPYLSSLGRLMDFRNMQVAPYPQHKVRFLRRLPVKI